jgi:hypothetical protein
MNENLIKFRIVDDDRAIEFLYNGIVISDIQFSVFKDPEFGLRTLSRMLDKNWMLPSLMQIIISHALNHISAVDRCQEQGTF